MIDILSRKDSKLRFGNPDGWDLVVRREVSGEVALPDDVEVRVVNARICAEDRNL